MYAGLPKPVYALFVATVVNGAGIFVFPFLSLFLTKKLGMGVRAYVVLPLAVAMH